MTRSPGWRWWVWTAIAIVFTVLFCRGLPYRDPVTFALLLLVPLLALRQAWRSARGL